MADAIREFGGLRIVPAGAVPQGAGGAAAVFPSPSGIEGTLRGGKRFGPPALA
jgi:hypothetical protein